MIQTRSHSSKNKTVIPPLSRKSSSAPDRSYPTTVGKLISLQQTIGNQQLQRLLALYQPLPSLSASHSQRLIQRKPNPVAPAIVEKALGLNILPPISRALDEGTVQIFTELVIAELQKKQWLIGYQSSSYAKKIQYVKGLLQQKGKTLDFLKKAYFTDRSDQDVESLHYWASQNPYK
jgi:hypothetical protein